MHSVRPLITITKTFVLKQARHIGDHKETLQLGLVVAKTGRRIQFLFINRRRIELRIN